MPRNYENRTRQKSPFWYDYIKDVDIGDYFGLSGGGGPDVITKVLIREEGRQESQRTRGEYRSRGQSEAGP